MPSQKWILGNLFLLFFLAIAVRCVQMFSETDWMCMPLAKNTEFRSMTWLESVNLEQPFLHFIRPQEQETIEALYDTFAKEIRCFPVIGACSADDSWGGVRTYGGDRTHEGCDIMAVDNIRGRLPIVSMTDGVVEAVGWLELGGYRIGVRSPGGIYYYYAHLQSCADGIAEGTNISAGTLLGYMGDSGYGAEGTTGQFAVHLHLGIYLTEDGMRFSVNPYPVLRTFGKSGFPVVI